MQVKRCARYFLLVTRSSRTSFTAGNHVYSWQLLKEFYANQTHVAGRGRCGDSWTVSVYMYLRTCKNRKTSYRKFQLELGSNTISVCMEIVWLRFFATPCGFCSLHQGVLALRVNISTTDTFCLFNNRYLSLTTYNASWYSTWNHRLKSTILSIVNVDRPLACPN